MRHFFLDTNVLLDFLARREPFGAVAAQLVEASAQKRVTLYVSSLSFSHIDYTLRKSITAPERLYRMAQLSGLVEIAPVDRAVIEAALASGFADFEDAIQYDAARAIPAIEAIVTRDPRGFATGQLPVLSPTEALRQLL